MVLALQTLDLPSSGCDLHTGVECLLAVERFYEYSVVAVHYVVVNAPLSPVL